MPPSVHLPLDWINFAHNVLSRGTRPTRGLASREEDEGAATSGCRDPSTVLSKTLHQLGFRRVQKVMQKNVFAFFFNAFLNVAKLSLSTNFR